MASTVENQLSQINSYNYWWNGGQGNLDPDLKRVQESGLNYYPMPIKIADCRKTGILTLRGPRRAGKSVAIKQLIRRLIDEDCWDPKDIVWLTADTIRTMSDFEQILLGICDRYDPKLICIDEVSGVKGWQNVIKKLVDVGTLSERCVILTGSSAHDIKSGAEKMAGRRGLLTEVPDRILLPMDFSDFHRQLQQYWPDMPVQVAFNHYLKTGGFPFRVQLLIQVLKEKREFDSFAGLSILDDIIFYEIQRRKLDRSIALEVIARIAINGVNALSYEGFAKALSISKDSVRRYLDALGDSFLVATISSYDTGRARVAPKKDRKFIWIDPALAFVAEAIGQGPSWDDVSRAEGLVMTSLLRQYERRLWEGLSAPRNVFTWKSSNGNEVDFLVVDRAKKVLEPYEVKFQESISDQEFQVMERAFGKATMISKSLSKKRPKGDAVPIWQFLANKKTDS